MGRTTGQRDESWKVMRGTHIFVVRDNDMGWHHWQWTCEDNSSPRGRQINYSRVLCSLENSSDGLSWNSPLVSSYICDLHAWQHSIAIGKSYWSISCHVGVQGRHSDEWPVCSPDFNTIENLRPLWSAMYTPIFASFRRKRICGWRLKSVEPAIKLRHWLNLSITGSFWLFRRGLHWQIIPSNRSYALFVVWLLNKFSYTCI